MRKINKVSVSQGGFSLVELLVVVAILAILAAIAIPLFLNQRSKATRAVLVSDVRNAGANLSAVSKAYPFSDPGTLSWDGGSESFAVVSSDGSTELVPSPVSDETTIRVAGDTNAWCVVAANSVNPDSASVVYGSSTGLGKCDYWFTKGPADGITPSGWYSIDYGEDGVWVAASTSGILMRSVDNGQTWVTLDGDAGVSLNGWRSVAYGENGVWVAVASGKAIRSTDNGATWVNASVGVPSGSWWAVDYGEGGVWVAVAYSTGATGKVLRSSNGGESWTELSNESGVSSGLWIDVYHGDGVWLAVGVGKTMRSYDKGETWVISAAPNGNGWHSVTFGNDTWVAVAYNGNANKVMKSYDGGETWTAYGSEVGVPNNIWYSVGFGEGTFVAVSASGTNPVMSSP